MSIIEVVLIIIELLLCVAMVMVMSLAVLMAWNLLGSEKPKGKEEQGSGV